MTLHQVGEMHPPLPDLEKNEEKADGNYRKAFSLLFGTFLPQFHHCPAESMNQIKHYADDIQQAQCNRSLSPYHSIPLLHHSRVLALAQNSNS